MSADRDFTPIKMAVKNALGNETFMLQLDPVLQDSLKELMNRIALEVSLSRFPQQQPGTDGILVVIVSSGSYASAKEVIRGILRDIIMAAWVPK